MILQFLLLVAFPGSVVALGFTRHHLMPPATSCRISTSSSRVDHLTNCQRRNKIHLLRLSGRPYVPFRGFTGDADKKVESVEKDLFSSSFSSSLLIDNDDDDNNNNDGINSNQNQIKATQDCIDALQAWLVAFHKNPSDDREIKVLEYASKMEDILNYMEQTLDVGPVIDAYAIPIHMSCNGDALTALRILSRMENQLQLSKNENKDNNNKRRPSDFENYNKRLIQYNRVLQGLASESPVSCSFNAVPVLMAMATQSSVDSLPPEDFIPQFTPAGVHPNFKSFLIVLQPLLKMNKEVDAYLQPICDLFQQADKMGLLRQKDGYLIKEMIKILEGDKEHLEFLLVDAEIDAIEIDDILADYKYVPPVVANLSTAGDIGSIDTPFQ